MKYISMTEAMQIASSKLPYTRPQFIKIVRRYELGWQVGKFGHWHVDEKKFHQFLEDRK